MRCSLVIMFLVGITFGADRNSGQAPVTLTATSSKVLGTSTFSFSGTTQCDAKGNMFFYSGVAPHDSVIFKLLADGSHEVYGLLNQDASDYYYVSFRADPEGGLSLLTGDKDDKPNVFKFRDDPTGPVRTELEVPAGIAAPTVHNFVELQNGHFLLQGFFGETASKDKRGRSYLAEFDSSGKFLRTSTEKDPASDLSDWPGDTSALQGEDGSIYILEPNKVLVLSQAVKTLREIRLKSPEPGYRPYQMYLSGRRLMVGYYNTAKQSPLDALYVLLDASTGRRLRVYKAAPELGNSLLCFSSEGFTFYRTEHGRVKLVIAQGE